MSRHPRVPGRPHHPPVAEVSEAQKDAFADRKISDHVQGEIDAMKYKRQAWRESLVHRGPDETVDVVDYLLNPTAAIASLVSFTVPNGMLAYFDQVGVYYSEGACTMCLAIGWRISIDERQVPNINHLTENWRFSNCGDPSSPLKLKPIWVQSGETISVQVQPVWAGVDFQNHLTMSGRLTGRIYKPATPGLIDVEDL